MIAFDVVDDAGAPNGVAAKEVCARALAHGLILLTCGQFGEAIRILVPLTVSDEVLEEGLKALECAVARPSAASVVTLMPRSEASA
jgi:4-aminobutyrate aminotransferase/(S)-3-amino-2-methylpropionate transaminase